MVEFRADRRVSIAAVTASSIARYRADVSRARIHLADALVILVRDVDIPGTIHRNAIGIVEFRAGRQDAIAVVTLSPSARNRADNSRAHNHLTDAEVALFGEVDIPGTIQRHGNGSAEFRADRQTIIAAVTRSPIASHRADIPRGIHLTDAVVVGVRDVDIPGTIHRHAIGLVEFRAGRHATAVVTLNPIARNRTDISRGIHLTDAAVVAVRDVDIPGTVHRHASGPVELRAGRRPSIAAVTRSPVARHSTDISRGIHLTDAAVVAVRDVDIPGTVHRHASGPVELRAGRRPSIAAVTRSPVARHSTDISRCIHLADALVGLVRDVDIPGTIQRHAKGTSEFRAGRCASIADGTASSTARHRTDGWHDRHLSDGPLSHR